MNRNDLFPSKYFKAADLGGKPITLVIKTASVEPMKNMQGGTDDKLVLGFINQAKSLVVNRTNFDFDCRPARRRDGRLARQAG